MEKEKPQAIITPPQAKRVVATSLLAIGGMGLVYYGTLNYWGRVEVLFVYVLAMLTLFGCFKFYQNTREELLLYEDRVASSSGELLFEVSNVKSIDNSLLSFKPSNGALIYLKSPMPMKVHYGLWWRVGKKVGIGGCTNRAEVNVMVDIIRQKLT